MSIARRELTGPELEEWLALEEKRLSLMADDAYLNTDNASHKITRATTAQIYLRQSTLTGTTEQHINGAE